LYLTLDRTCGNTFYNESGKKNVNNDDREDGKGDHYIHLSHVEFQKVCASKLCDQHGKCFLLFDSVKMLIF